MFRVYDTKEKKWVEDEAFVSRIGDLFLSKKSFMNKLRFEKMELVSERRYVAHNYIRMNDKNGKCIYEGDICWCDVDDGVSCVVAYLPEQGSYRLFDNKNAVCYPILQENLDKIEVVGNVFDNPDLIDNQDEDE